jgi:hypothetical protein
MSNRKGEQKMTKKQKATAECAAKIATSSIVYILKSRLEGAKRDLARAKRWSFGGDQITEAGLDRAHHEGRIEELESIIKSLKG